VLPLLAVLAAALVAGCSASGASTMLHADSDSLDIPAFDTLTVRQVVDTARHAHARGARASAPRLDAQAEAMGSTMTFLARFQNAFLAAGRGKRVLVDLGRIGAKVKTPEDRRAFEAAAAALSPVRVGDRFRIHGPWGSDDAVVTGFDVWNGRIVATLAVPPLLDRLARAPAPLVALATHADSAEPAAVDSCARDSAGGTLAARLPALRDSLARVANADTAGFPPRLVSKRRVEVTEAVGCFGAGRALLFATTVGGAYEKVHERAVLVDTAGTVMPLRVSDLRFKAHQALRALDADGDGVDDIAALGHAARTGGTVLLRLDPEKRRLDYIVSGFAWENY
jgi:hypothetical protein